MIDDIVQPSPRGDEILIIYLYLFYNIHLSSMYIAILGSNNKMESYHLSTIYSTKSLLYKALIARRNFSTQLNKEHNLNKEFLFWFSGFTDGEGNFSITLDRTYIRFRFKINLHIDDLEVLNTIKSKLKIGKVIIEQNRNSCAFIVEKFAELKDVLCPIFINFPLHTTKKLDFQDFHTAILIKAKSINGNLSSSDKEKILSLKKVWI